ncbi:MAG: hypothetical protein BJ554DRAFT_2123 [Olpidium bornovanus]|uniref:Uncharacterized protein n=1 Tax=Olpidium bornovanus TaxID=278681 RepID=A0A8H7ZQH4_9FUNG|nr:MAG: hypothetical protein BJ554DRAFT_2123 [Olpidium bornovanus]
MAFNVLSDPVKKRQFDSVDPGIQDEFPSSKEQGDFFALYSRFFEMEARFSNRQPVPLLGSYDSPKKDVEEFYDFWYNFDSWRSFEYLDKHDTDLADNRDDKRYMDKKNRAERAQRKKEDNAKLRKYVDQTLKFDPRIAKFRREESMARNAKKEARCAAERDAARAKKRAEEEAKAAAERAVAEAKLEAEAAKKEKDRKKYALKKEKKTLKKLIAEHNYFLPAGSPVAGPDQVEQQLNKLDSVFAKLPVNELEKLRTALEAGKGDSNIMSATFEAAVPK